VSGILTDVEGTTGGGTPKCANVVFSPPSGNTPINVNVSTSTVPAHIFYARSVDGSVDPTHTGDSAGPGTIRIGSNNGSFSTGAGTKVYRALAYAPGYLDSDITEGDYEPGN